MKKIILATTSPYRKRAFQMLGIEFEAEDSNVEEKFDSRPDNPEELVKHLAKLKAEAVAKKHSEGIIIGFDSVGWFSGLILEKPQSRKEAFERLKALSENNHDFYTGIHIIDAGSGKFISEIVKTSIEIRKLSDSEINKYLDQDPDYKTYSPGYDPLENYSSSFARVIHGSYNNFLRGIPTEFIIEKLKDFGVKI